MQYESKPSVVVFYARVRRCQPIVQFVFTSALFLRSTTRALADIEVSTPSMKTPYNEAVSALNSLQTNAGALQEARNRIKANQPQKVNVEQTIKYLSRIGVTVKQLEANLSVIHVSGTKGKGSTSAYCESILRCHGYKTGFFSSPHLVAVRERIRINGHPLSEADFTRHFWNVYKKLEAKRDSNTDMPAYFKFLTVMAFNVFLQENVDVAVIEVGVGGEYDCTNILTKVPVVGITSLGLDHTSVLGNTIEEIARQKAGIMKPGCHAFIAYKQPVESLRILHDVARRRNSSILIAPPIDEYTYQGGKIELAMKGPVHKINAGLALQLAKTWMDLKNGKLNAIGYPKLLPGDLPLLSKAPAFKIDNVTAYALKTCTWPGRNQIITRKGKNGTYMYYLDGAHTAESIQQCVEWYLNTLKEHRRSVPRTLIFNATGDRDVATLLKPLVQCQFHTVMFSPNLVSTVVQATSDQANFMVTTSQQMERCVTNKNMWLALEKQNPRIGAAKIVMTCPTVTDTLKYIESQSSEHDILVTGSLHLIGAVLSILDPDLSISTNASCYKNMTSNLNSTSDTL